MVETHSTSATAQTVNPSRSLRTGATYLVHQPASSPSTCAHWLQTSMLILVGPAVILNTRRGRLGGHEAYISYTGQDKRLDAWVPEKDVGAQVVDEPVAGPSTGAPLPLKSPGGSKRRKLAKVCWRFAERNAVLTRPAARCACASRPGYRDRARARCVPRAR
jgi:hypothetical protein